MFFTACGIFLFLTHVIAVRELEYDVQVLREELTLLKAKNAMREMMEDSVVSSLFKMQGEPPQSEDTTTTVEVDTSVKDTQ